MRLKSILLIAIATISLATATMAQVPNYVPTNGLLAWYPFTSNANDLSGNGYNGRNSGATLTTDRFGNPNCAMQFFSSQYIEVPNLYQTNLNGYTISAWFKRPSSSNGNDGAILSGSSPGNLPAGLRFYIGSINRLLWGIESNPGGNGVVQNAPGDTANYDDNNWHFCVATFSSPNGLVAGTAFKIYVDGSLARTITAHTNWPTSDTTVYAPVNNGTRNTIIGNCGGSYYNFNNVFKGTLDDIGIWNRALNQLEISALYNGCSASVTIQPISQSVNIFNNAQFTTASSDPLATYQWQTDLGVGFQNLNSVGQYSGTSNDTLTIANTTLSNNNQAFRCIISSGSCTDTSNVAILTVNNNVGINEFTQDNLFSVYPNPAHSQINVKADTKLLGSIFTVYDNTGKVVLSGKIISENTTIELGNLSGGIYLFSVGENLKQTFKVIKE
jgi:Concanavalin A-like lectin/glucanases superfamily/Secretion system C-terminal sorting domain